MCKKLETIDYLKRYCIDATRKKRGCPHKNWEQGIRRAMRKRHLNDEEWNNRRQQRICITTLSELYLYSLNTYY